MKVAVIGGGPAGLATLKFLSTAHQFFDISPIEVRLFESESDIGGTFEYRVYEDAELVSSKYLTAFSDFRLPSDAPDFVTPQLYVEYLKRYAEKFNLNRHVHCNSRVKSVQRKVSGQGHIVEVDNPDGQTTLWHCDAVAICTGIHVIPSIPQIPGIESVPVVLHSSQLTRRAQFGINTHVVVMGAGETGMDIAHLAVTSQTASVTICHRQGFFCAPKIIPVPRGQQASASGRPNKPVDASVASLFDTAYAHPVLQQSQLLWFAYDQWVKKMHWLISGTEEGPDQWVGQMSKSRKHMDSIFLVKSDRALPYLSTGHRSTSKWNGVRSALLNVPIKDTNGRRINTKPWPNYVDKDGNFHFPDSVCGKVGLRPDVVVLATGYSTDFSILDSSYPRLLDTDVRGVYKEGDVSVGFIGFVRPSIGAIPPLAEMQAQFWALRLLQHTYPIQVSRSIGGDAIQSYDLDYKLHPRAGYDLYTNKRAVDHESYVYQLGLDMGSAPKISYVASKGWKLLFTWAMGSNFNPKFRLVGPWKDEQCAMDIMRGELYGVVKRSGGYMYLLTYTIVPFVCFGLISVALYTLTAILAAPRGVFCFYRRTIAGGNTSREKQKSTWA